MRAGAALLGLGAIAIASPCQTLEGSEGTFEFRPGVVVDRERAAIYLMNPEGGIDAVDLGSGDLLWRTDQAAKPLLRHGDRLVAQKETRGEGPLLRIASLDLRDVAAEARLFDVPLPAGVQARIDDGMQASFSSVVRIHDGALMLRWEQTFRRATGPPPGPDDRASDRNVSGSVEIELDSGRISPVDEMPTPLEPELPEALVRLRQEQGLPLRRVGEVLFAIERTAAAGEQRVVLQRWDAETGEALADVTLFDGGLRFRSVSADRRHLLASRRDSSDGRIWEWAVFSLETGAKVGELRHAEPGALFFVAGSRLIHETNVTERRTGGELVVEPGKLRAVDLETSREAWSHAIRDTRYRGHDPPRTQLHR